MKQQQQHWKNMVNMCINNKCLFTLHPRFANRGKRTRRKKREHRRGRFFPPSLSISHIEEPRRCWSVTQPSILSFFLFPSFLPLRWRIKKKEKKGMVVDRTRHAELRGKMPWKLVLSMLGFIENFIDSSLMHARINETSTSWLGFTYTPPCQSCDRTVNRGTMRERVNGINQTRDWN